MMPRFVIRDFPMCPTVNALYASGRFQTNKNKFAKPTFKSKRWKSDEYKVFETYAAQWAVKNTRLVKEIKLAAQDAIIRGFQIRVDSYFVFPRAKIICKSKKLLNAAKEIDASNYIKASHDLLAKIIQVDDRHFWSGYFEKVETLDTDRPKIVFTLSQFKPRNIDELYLQLGKTPNESYREQTEAPQMCDVL